MATVILQVAFCATRRSRNSDRDGLPSQYWRAIAPAAPLWAFLRWPSRLSPLDHCIVRGNRKHRGSRVDPAAASTAANPSTQPEQMMGGRPPRELTNSSSTSPEAPPQN
jgi:hypothetical protein